MMDVLTEIVPVNEESLRLIPEVRLELLRQTGLHLHTENSETGG